MSKHETFIEKIIDESPDFMILEKDNEKYLLFDRFVTSLSNEAMPWLFKVYLDKNYNILRENKITKEIIKKYENYDLDIIDDNGNIFLNKNIMYVIIIELENSNQLKYNEEMSSYMLI